MVFPSISITYEHSDHPSYGLTCQGSTCPTSVAQTLALKLTIFAKVYFDTRSGVGNLHVRPAGHMQPASDFFAAREMSQEKEEKKSIYFTSSQKTS